MVHQPHNGNTEETNDVMQISNAKVPRHNDAEHHNPKDYADHSTRVKHENVLVSRQTTGIKKSLMKVTIYLLVLSSVGAILYVVWHFAISIHSK